MTSSPPGESRSGQDGCVEDDVQAPEIQIAIASQADWAARKGLALTRDRTYLADRSAAVLGGLHPETREQLACGAGKELRRLPSLRSSTALALNVFQPWKTNPQAIGEFFGAKGVREMGFEQQQPIWPNREGSKLTPPHLDVLLTGTGPTVGIESKYLELYDPADNHFAPRYFPTDEPEQPLWAGLPGCRLLTEQIAARDETFCWLATGQLLKHALGLSKNQPNGFRLVLVWYRIEGTTADAIEAEIGRFSRAVSAELDFTALTYQELISLFKTIRRIREPVPEYFENLDDRYQLGMLAPRLLPLVSLGKATEAKRKSGLAETTGTLDVAALVTAYHQTIARAPQRALGFKRYLMATHEGRGGSHPRSQEKVAAKAIFNRRRPVVIDSEPVDILDYEVPLAARGSDDGVGDIDLLGRSSVSGRPWIIELKVGANIEPPYSALLQALRYSAMVDANRRQLSTEVKARTNGSELTWPGVIAVAADRVYWGRWQRESTRAGDWLSTLRELAARITEALGIKVVFVDLGDLSWELVDGAAQLTSPLEAHLL